MPSNIQLVHLTMTHTQVQLRK